MTIHCDYCGASAEKVTGERVYPHRPDLYHKTFYVCAPCDARVSAHADGRPLGTMANAELRSARRRAHEAFDPLWRSRFMSRSRAYTLLANTLKLTKSECHIGLFNKETCDLVVRISNTLTNH